MRVAIDLLWVRHGISGGTESVIRNLMHGFGQFSKDTEFVLLVARDNADTFREYQKYQNMRFKICDTNSTSRTKRAIWQRLHIKRLMKDKGVDVYFSPIYSTPGKLNIPSVAIIHDLQALHYPEYFSTLRNKYMHWSWQDTCNNANTVITISNFCRNDIIKHLKINEDKVKVIYNPIIPADGNAPFKEVSKKYHIKEKGYYYTVSSLAKHKNVVTLIKAFMQISQQDTSMKLVITGIKVNAANEIIDFVNAHGLNEHVIFTGFISNEERDALYKGCKAFVYPSIFEGFGMPPIEAMIAGAPVITTKETSLEEVTEGLCTYVNNPLDENEFIDCMLNCACTKENISEHLKDKYSLSSISSQYCNVFKELRAQNSNV